MDREKYRNKYFGYSLWRQRDDSVKRKKKNFKEENKEKVEKMMKESQC